MPLTAENYAPDSVEVDILCENARFSAPAAPFPRNSSVAAPWMVERRGGGGGFIADPVAVGEATEAALEVEREPAGELRMGRVLPEPVGAAQCLEVADELSHPAIVSRDAAAGGEIEDEGRVDSDVEREPSRGPFEPDQPGDLPAEGGGVAGLPGEEMVDADAGSVRSSAFGVQREAGDGARRRRATPFFRG